MQSQGRLRHVGPVQTIKAIGPHDPVLHPVRGGRSLLEEQESLRSEDCGIEEGDRSTRVGSDLVWDLVWEGSGVGGIWCGRDLVWEGSGVGEMGGIWSVGDPHLYRDIRSNRRHQCTEPIYLRRLGVCMEVEGTDARR